MTLNLIPFPDINAPSPDAVWRAMRDRRDCRREAPDNVVQPTEGELPAPPRGWPRVFPGL